MTKVPGEIKRDPENYADMIDKLQKREKENISRALERHNVKDLSELKQVAKKAISVYEERSAAEHKPVNPAVQKEPKSQEIHAARKEAEEKTSSIVQQAWQQLSPEMKDSLEKKVIGGKELKGRISQTPPAA